MLTSLQAAPILQPLADKFLVENEASLTKIRVIFISIRTVCVVSLIVINICLAVSVKHQADSTTGANRTVNYDRDVIVTVILINSVLIFVQLAPFCYMIVVIICKRTDCMLRVVSLDLLPVYIMDLLNLVNSMFNAIIFIFRWGRIRKFYFSRNSASTAEHDNGDRIEM